MSEIWVTDDTPAHRQVIRRGPIRARLTRDLAADWTRWSRAERLAATLFAVLMSTTVLACYAWMILHPLH